MLALKELCQGQCACICVCIERALNKSATISLQDFVFPWAQSLTLQCDTTFPSDQGK